jgi:hypothetical protein
MDIPIDAVVQCTDGPGGRSTCVVLNPVTRRLSHVVVKQNTFPHLVLREGHLWGEKDVLIPFSEIGQIDKDRVHLTLSKEEVANLPTIPVRRWQDELSEE